MANKIYGQFVTPTELLEKSKEIFAEYADAFEVLEEHESTYEDVLDVIDTHSLARYAADHRLYTTMIFSYEVDDRTLEASVSSMIL